MGKRDGGVDRAERLLEQIGPVLLEILDNAPDYGTCAFEVTMHDGEATFVEEKRCAVHKIGNRGKMMDEAKAMRRMPGESSCRRS